MNKKGFSLIELLGALVILGLILLVVIPAVSRLLTSNDAKEYNNYLKIIETGAKAYADTMIDSLGASGDTGCIRVELKDLIAGGYIKKFNSKDITCDGAVRINNDKGKLNIYVNLTCINNDKKEVFKQEKINNDDCIPFVPKEEGSIINRIIKNGLGSNGNTASYDNKQFITGNNPNNYVWYSGKLWRVVWYDNTAVKMISNDIVTVMGRNSGSIQYDNSFVDKWLRNKFLPTLKDHDVYLADTIWDVSPTSSYGELPSKSNTITSKVGLLNSYEASKMGDFIDQNYKWLLSNYYGSNVRLATKGGSSFVTEEVYSYDNYYAIRPAITLKGDAFVVTGDGSKSFPYILEGNSTNIPKGTLINTRLSGEYLKINDVLYRIVGVSNNLTKVIMVGSLPELEYGTISYNFPYSSLYDYLKNDWYVNNLGTDKELIFENGSWCSKIITGAVEYNYFCTGDIATSPVGIPSLGDIYTSNNDGNTDSFWTIDGYSSMEVNIIDGYTKNNLSITSKARVKPVMYLKDNVIISSGKGTVDNPFILKLK